MARRPITQGEFRRALSLIGRPTPGQKKFLRAHYRATGRVATMSNLADAAGYGNYGGVNLQYGGLAKRIAQALGRTLPRTRVSLLTEFIGPGRISNKEWVLFMRPAFAAALSAAGWVR
jgi:hypothetical protein